MKRVIFILLIFLFCIKVTAQNSKNPVFSEGLKFRLTEDGSRFVKFSVLSQIWIRHTQTNPGTLVFDDSQEEITDIGVRRARFVLQGQVTDKVYVFTQFGINNFSYLSQRKQGAFFHDIVIDYQFDKKIIFGGGLSSFGGPGRFSRPSAGRMLGIDVPLSQLVTTDVTDQFARKLGIFIKGQVNKIDYNLAVSKPLAIQNSTKYKAAPTNTSYFSDDNSHLMYHGYLKYQFFDKESNKSAYNAATYFGEKKIFAIGMGFLHQQDAVWHLRTPKDTVSRAMQVFVVDAFYDFPCNLHTKDAVTLYASYYKNNFGVNYIRNTGIMNPGNGVVTSKATFNGTGNAYPLYGTGQLFYFQGAYKFKRNFLGEKNGTLQPYVYLTYGDYDRLSDPMIVTDTGLNWLINGHKAKLTLNYQSRPVFEENQNEELIETQRRGMWIMQYQISF